MKEKSIETAIMMRIRFLGGWCQKVQSGVAMMACRGRGGMRNYRIKLADRGTPDIIGCVNGKFIAIEVKKDMAAIRAWAGEVHRESNPTAEAQFLQIEKIKDAHGFAIVSCSADDVEERLREMKIIK